MDRYRVLVVDDDKPVADSLKDSLEACGIYEAKVCYSGLEALELLKVTPRFDANLVDQRMPEMTGVEFIQELLTLEEDPLVYVVTAEDDGVALKKAEIPKTEGGLPIKRYVPKPWPQSLFSVDLRMDLEERELRTELSKSVEKHSEKQRQTQRKLTVAQDRMSLIEKQEASLAGALTVVSGINHELGNLTTGIVGRTRSLGFLKQDLHEVLKKLDVYYLNKMESIHAGLNELSDRLLDCTKFAGTIVGKNNELKSIVPVKDIINASLSDLKKELRKAGVNVIKNLQSPVKIPCYHKQLRHAFYQILKNSVEAMPQGGTLTISIFADNAAAKVIIQDTGFGIPEEMQPKVFIPFFTQKKIYGGKGGSIAHKIITDNHRGTLQTESYTADMIRSNKYPEKSQGTTVTVFLYLGENL